MTNQQRFNLTITKNGISNINHDADEQQSTIYTIVGMIDDEVIIEMNVAICGNDSITICRLPVGSYTVEEDSNWSWRYTPDSATKDVVITEDATASVTYVNTRAYPYWLSGDFYCENWFTTEGIKKRDGSDNVIG